MTPPPMPATCSEAALAKWVHAMWSDNDDLDPTDHDIASAVRALLDAKVREALEVTSDEHCYAMWVGHSHIEAIIARVLGAAK